MSRAPGLAHKLALMLLVATTPALSGCREQDAPMPPTPKEPQIVSQPEVSTQIAETVVLTGVRLTKGNAVDCPQLQDSAGRVHVVSAISPSVPLGGKVSLRGVYGVSTRCVGTVLIVEEETILPD